LARRSAKKKAGLSGPAPRTKAQPPVRSAGRAEAGRPRLYLWGIAAAAIVVVGIVLGVVFTRGNSSVTSRRAIPWAELGALQTGPPPWNNGVAQLTNRLAPLGLEQLSSEGTVIHIHQHLDAYVNGKHVMLPAGVGIYDSAYLTQVHVHDTTGVIHVESPTTSTYILGQLFGEWGVKLTARCLGTYCGHLQWWVNGTKMTGDPASLTLKAHQEIVIAAGKPPFTVPKSYKFPAGE
jgi:hypothetical protein